MKQEDLILAAFGASKIHSYEPVQIQKLIFIFQQRASQFFKVRPFDFRAYDYGPFSVDIYSRLDELAAEGYIIIEGEPYSRYRLYCLSESGKEKAKSFLDLIPDPYKKYLHQLADWIQSQTFSQLVGAVYKEFPAMRANSVFHD
ncbi:MAG: hypothetical protein ABSF88_09205 [Candidatus Aminicenantales bacterium]